LQRFTLTLLSFAAVAAAAAPSYAVLQQQAQSICQSLRRSRSAAVRRIAEQFCVVFDLQSRISPNPHTAQCIIIIINEYPEAGQ